jgi:hypothetical protein
MTKRTRKTHKSRSNVQELVVVATANTMEEAKDYESLLRNNAIRALVKQQPDEFTEDKRYVIMVPDEMADEANVIIESQDSYDDFYDSSLEDDDEDNIDSEMFDDMP